jgi:hypothetical protein
LVLALVACQGTTTPEPAVDFGLTHDSAVSLSGLSSAADMVPDGSGGWWVLDVTEHRVTRFSADGDRLDSLGVFGEGPGELHTPVALAMTSDGGLAVVDLHPRRLMVFAPPLGSSPLGDRSYPLPAMITHLGSGPAEHEVTLLSFPYPSRGVVAYRLNLMTGGWLDSMVLWRLDPRLRPADTTRMHYLAAGLTQGRITVSEIRTIKATRVEWDRSATEWATPVSPEARRNWSLEEANAMFAETRLKGRPEVRLDSAAFVARMMSTEKRDLVAMRTFTVGGDGAIWMVRTSEQGPSLERIDSVGQLTGRKLLETNPELLIATPEGVATASYVADGNVAVVKYTASNESVDN